MKLVSIVRCCLCCCQSIALLATYRRCDSTIVHVTELTELTTSSRDTYARTTIPAEGHRCKIATPTKSTKTTKPIKIYYTKNSSIRNRISRLLYRRKRLNWGCLQVLTLLESDVAVVARMDADRCKIAIPTNSAKTTLTAVFQGMTYK
jgi:hypothetical protein